MANEEHIRILKSGVIEWNRWRLENDYSIDPDFSNADLVSLDLTEATLFHANFDGANLSGSKLSKASLTLTSFREAICVKTDFSDSNLQLANIVKANFSTANLLGADLSNTSVFDSNFEGAFLAEANLTNATFADSNLRSVDLIKAKLFGVRLNGVDLTRAKLHGAFLWGVGLNETDLSDAVVGFTTINNTDLSRTKGLEKIIHDNPCSIGIDTIFMSKGKIPEIFLRKSGIPENLVTYLPSLIRESLEFYNCFISFTEADDLFSEKLYNDLQLAGIRCWRWKEDAKWGKSLMHSIDEAVRLYDKLIVVCSESSLNSPAVIREIERALQREDDLSKQGKSGEVLFPIRLDDYILDGWDHYLKADLVTKNVGDFRTWTTPISYQKSLQRLIRDLRK